MYFRQFPKLLYPYTADGKNKTKIVPDIFRRIQLDKFFKNKLILVDYFIDDVEKPEDIAYKYYGTTDYHWIVLIANDIIDVNKEWPKSTRDLPKYVEDKYGAGNSTAVHHYEDSSTGFIVDWDAAKVATGEYKEVTNFDYEAALNDNKRQIFLLDKRYVRDIIEQFKDLIG